MKLKQLIYTSLKGQGNIPSGYRYYAKSAGVSPTDAEQLKNIFGESRAVRRFVEDHPAPESLTQKTIDREAPVCYAYLRLQSGNYCWCSVSAIAKDCDGNTGGIYFHAMISETAPTFMPISLFEHVEFTTSLTEAQKNETAALSLPIINIDENSIKFRHNISDNALGIEQTQILISAMNKAKRERKPLLMNHPTNKIVPAFCELFSYFSSSDATDIYFSTLTDDEIYARNFVLNHMGSKFDYDLALNHVSVLVVDTLTSKRTNTILIDKVARVLTNLVYENPEEYKKFREFLARYSAKIPSFDMERVLDLYYFVETEKFLEFTPEELLLTLDDKYLNNLDSKKISKKIEQYIAADKAGKAWLDIYAALYRFSSDKDSVSAKVLSICFNDVMSSTDLKLKEQYCDALRKNFGTDFYLDVLKAYKGVKNALLAGVEKAHIFDFIIKLLEYNHKGECSKESGTLFRDVFEQMSRISILSVRDKLLPAVDFCDQYFDFIVDRLYNPKTVSFDDIIDWLAYSSRTTNSKVARAFTSRGLRDFSADRIYSVIVKDKRNFDTAVKYMTERVSDNEYFALIRGFVDKFIEESDTSTDKLIHLLSILRSEVVAFVEALKKVRAKIGEAPFLNVIYLYTKGEGISFLKTISADFPDVAVKIISHNVKTPETYVTIYLSEFFNQGHLKEWWQNMFEAVTEGLSLQEKTAAAVQVLKNATAENDAPIVTYMCGLFDSALWDMEHSDGDFIRDGLATVRAKLMPESDLNNVAFFTALIKWEDKESSRSVDTISEVCEIALDCHDRCLFICRNYLPALIAMSKVYLRKYKDDFLLKVIMLHSSEMGEVIWDLGYRYEKRRLYRKAVKAWLTYGAELTLAAENYRNPLLIRVFSGLGEEDYVKLFRCAKRKKNGEILHQLRIYYNSLPEHTQRAVVARLPKDFEGLV